MVTFARRIQLVSSAVQALYASVGCFVADALIGATSWRKMLVEATLPLFLVGILLIVGAIICQILELQASNRTIMLEVRDVRQRRDK